MSKPGTQAIRLLLVDDHEVVRLGLRTLFERTGRIQVVGEAGTLADAVTKAADLKPDLVLLDIRLPDGSGVEACREIRANRPATRVLFLTSFADEQAVMAAIVGGAGGYVLKEIGGESLIQAIEAVADGQSILDPAITRPILARMQALSKPAAQHEGDPLSPQEQKVLALVAEGKTNKEIAAVLHLSDKTVKNYLSHIFQKLQISRRSQAAAYFVKRSQP
jgi:DNA-binding NarL/FixJ family response regulator